MPELLEQDDDSESTILHHLVKALANESSLRSRRTAEITISGLLDMPKSTILPPLNDPQEIMRTLTPVDDFKTRSNSTPHSMPNTTNINNKISPSKTPLKKKNRKDTSLARIFNDTTSLIPSKLEKVTVDKYSNKQNKPSSENWIPDYVRMKSRMRDLKIAKENLDVTLQREADVKRSLKGVNVSLYDRAVNEESLSMVKKIPCACCLQKYLYVNLQLKVSQKAIIDIRVKWTGGLTSSTVFQNTLDAVASDKFLPNSISNTATSIMNNSTSRKDINKKNAPIITPIKAYNDVRVCLFCAQFFQVQEKYRPSYEEMSKNEKRAARLVELSREMEYWDPLKMVEKDRETDEAERTTKEHTLTNKSAQMIEETINQEAVENIED